MPDLTKEEQAAADKAADDAAASTSAEADRIAQEAADTAAAAAAAAAKDAANKPADSVDLVTLKSPDGKASVTHDGVTYKTVKGYIQVPPGCVDACVNVFGYSFPQA